LKYLQDRYQTEEKYQVAKKRGISGRFLKGGIGEVREKSGRNLGRRLEGNSTAGRRILLPVLLQTAKFQELA
jgi:hypothetical protein